jgi:hypothetical protein
MASAPAWNAASMSRRAVSTEPSWAAPTWATTRQGWASPMTRLPRVIAEAFIRASL